MIVLPLVAQSIPPASAPAKDSPAAAPATAAGSPAGAPQATTAPYGSADFHPSSARPIGWRGDGTGIFDGAQPPVAWGRVCPEILELRSQAKKPAEGDKGDAVSDGVIRNWLVLGPVAIAEGKTRKNELPDEAALEGEAGAKCNGATWKAISTDTSWVDFMEALGLDRDSTKPADIQQHMAYAQSWVWTPKAVTLQADVVCNDTEAFLWVNGKRVSLQGILATTNRFPIQLETGWNRITMRATPAPLFLSSSIPNWFFTFCLYGSQPAGAKSRNIVWSIPLTDSRRTSGVSSPIVVGDRVLVTAEGFDLICVDKNSGKVLWVQATTPADIATAKERQDNPDIFREIDASSAELRKLLDQYRSDPAAFAAFTNDLKTSLRAQKAKCERNIKQLITKVDRDKYGCYDNGCAGWASPTPVSDGKHVYVVFDTGVVACYSLDGKRKWATFCQFRHTEQNYTASPALHDGTLVISHGNSTAYYGLKADSGELAWSTPFNPSHVSHFLIASPVLVGQAGQTFYCHGMGTVLRLGDHKLLAEQPLTTHKGYDILVSPVYSGNEVFYVDGFFRKGKDMCIWKQTLPAAGDEVASEKLCTFSCRKFPTFTSYDNLASPLLHEGLLYVVNMDGVLTVIDVKDRKVLYQKLLDTNSSFLMKQALATAGNGSSPTLAGKYIYIWGNQGTCVVIEPGRTFKQVARNRIEEKFSFYGRDYGETTVASPLFDGNRIFMRGNVNLYCIGEK